MQQPRSHGCDPTGTRRYRIIRVKVRASSPVFGGSGEPGRLCQPATLATSDFIERLKRGCLRGLEQGLRGAEARLSRAEGRLSGVKDA